MGNEMIRISLRKKCPNTEFFLVIFSPNTGKYGPEKTLYLNTFYAVRFFFTNSKHSTHHNSKTKCCLPKYDFPNSFDVMFTPNHWSNFEKCASLFEKIIFPYLKAKKEEPGYPKEQYS